jgi:hypothetical protein
MEEELILSMRYIDKDRKWPHIEKKIEGFKSTKKWSIIRCVISIILSFILLIQIPNEGEEKRNMFLFMIILYINCYLCIKVRYFADKAIHSYEYILKEKQYL